MTILDIAQFIKEYPLIAMWGIYRTTIPYDAPLRKIFRSKKIGEAKTLNKADYDASKYLQQRGFDEFYTERTPEGITKTAPGGAAWIIITIKWIVIGSFKK